MRYSKYEGYNNLEMLSPQVKKRYVLIKAGIQRSAFAKGWNSMLGQPITEAKLKNKNTSYGQCQIEIIKLEQMIGWASMFIALMLPDFL